MAHSYSSLWKIPITVLRFFTVYGPWGRPDMALFKFTKSIIKGEPIDIYNNGEMYRDFTYIDDIVNGVIALTIVPPKEEKNIDKNDSLSTIAPFRIVNIGNSKKVIQKVSFANKTLDIKVNAETSLPCWLYCFGTLS